MSDGTKSAERKGRKRRRRERNLEIAMGGATVLQWRKKFSLKMEIVCCGNGAQQSDSEE